MSAKHVGCATNTCNAHTLLLHCFEMGERSSKNLKCQSFAIFGYDTAF